MTQTIASLIVNFVSLHPGCTAKEIMDALPDVNKSSISSTLNYHSKHDKKLRFAREDRMGKDGRAYRYWLRQGVDLEEAGTGVEPKMEEFGGVQVGFPDSIQSIIEQILSRREDSMSELVHSLGVGIAKQIAAEVALALPQELKQALAGIVPVVPNMQEVEVSVAPKKIKLPRVAIVGLLPGQNATIVHEYAGKLDIICYGTGIPAGRLAGVMDNLEKVIFMKFIDHSTTSSAVKKDREKLVGPVHGMTSLRRELNNVLSTELTHA